MVLVATGRPCAELSFRPRRCAPGAAIVPATNALAIATDSPRLVLDSVRTSFPLERVERFLPLLLLLETFLLDLRRVVGVDLDLVLDAGPDRAAHVGARVGR